MALKRTPLKRGNTTLKKSPIKKGSSTLKKGGKIKPRIKSKEELEEVQKKKDMRTEFFRQCGEILPKRSEISGKKINPENRAHFHHNYPKSIYPEVEFCFDVITVLTFEEHQEVEKDLNCFEVTAKKREWIEDNWDECVKKSQEWVNNYEKQNEKQE